MASTGFGNSLTGSTGRPQQGTVQMAGFHNDTTGGSGATPKLANTESEITQVQILFHPRPEYTSEAKQMKIQGEVVLEVRFSADGKVQVLRVSTDGLAMAWMSRPFTQQNKHDSNLP